MANVMNMANLKNHVSRNGFDLSEKVAFTAKVGQLLPVMVKEVIPGDKFKINVKAFARTQPVNTAAYTRIRQYYDFFFVPYSQIWRNFKSFITQMTSNPTRAVDLTQPSIVPTQLPYFTTQDLTNIVIDLSSYNDAAGTHFAYTDDCGFSVGYGMCKLFQYLGYGDYSSYLGYKPSTKPDTPIDPRETRDLVLNPFPLLAYQKIYFDFFRNQQWEQNKPWCYNLDYVTAADLHLPIETLLYGQDDEGKNRFCDSIATLRYCNWNKDLFMGLLPRAQYSQSPATVSMANGLKFDILSLRQAEALQKWSEISLSGNQDYKSQIEKHFGVTMPQCMSDTVHYLGGSSDSLDISEVVNHTITSGTPADIAGKGVGVTDGYIDFDTEEYGVVMCIYHAVPLLDYSTDGIFKHNLRSLPTDFAIPEFDKLGLQSVSMSEFLFDTARQPNDSNEDIRTIGYAPRYYDYKTSYDRVLGAFKTSEASWNAPVSKDFLKKIGNLYSGINYKFLKCYPSVLDPIFGVNADSTVNTDQLLINCAFDVKAVRNLDYDGLPY